MTRAVAWLAFASNESCRVVAVEQWKLDHGTLHDGSQTLGVNRTTRIAVFLVQVAGHCHSCRCGLWV